MDPGFNQKREKSVSVESRTEFEKVYAKTCSTLLLQLVLVNFARSFLHDGGHRRREGRRK